METPHKFCYTPTFFTWCGEQGYSLGCTNNHLELIATSMKFVEFVCFHHCMQHTKSPQKSPLGNMFKKMFNRENSFTLRNRRAKQRSAVIMLKGSDFLVSIGRLVNECFSV